MKKAVIISEKAIELSELLRSEGFEIILNKNNTSVDNRIADHPDISFFFDGINTLFVSPETAEYSDIVREYCKNVVVIDARLGSEYPDDVKLNCVALGSFFICNIKTVSETVLAHMKNIGYTVIDVCQGYAKCSVLPVSDNALITDDVSIADKCRFFGIDVLLVRKGDVQLSGFEYGFIGGCAGHLCSDRIYFNGDIRSHCDFEKISEFLYSKNIKFVCSDNKLTDIGSILPLYKI